MPPGRSTLRIGSRAAATREPRQVRKEAALSADRRVPRTGLVRADRRGGARTSSVDGGCTALPSLGTPSVDRQPGATDGRSCRLPASRPGPASHAPTRLRLADYTCRRAHDTPLDAFLDVRPHGALPALARPTFDQIVGQGTVVETLRNAVRLDRLAHGFLFVGPRGTGKTSMARILAKAVNCTNLVDGEPCDACPSCVAIREGRALDVVELDAASNNRVDDMRELAAPCLHGAPLTCVARSSSSTRSSASRRAGTSSSRRSRNRPTACSSSSAPPTRPRSGRPSCLVCSASRSGR